MLTTINQWYNVFLSLFPTNWHGPVSLIVLLFIAGLIWHVIRKSGLWLVLLVVLVPTLLPVFKTIGQTIIDLLKMLLERASI